jgi:hypothetical protein
MDRGVEENFIAESSACPLTAECPKHWKGFAVRGKVPLLIIGSDHPLEKIFRDIPARFQAFPLTPVRDYDGRDV